MLSWEIFLSFYNSCVHTYMFPINRSFCKVWKFVIVESLDRSFQVLDWTRRASKFHKTKTLAESVHFVKHANLWRSSQAMLKWGDTSWRLYCNKHASYHLHSWSYLTSSRKEGYINEPFTQFFMKDTHANFQVHLRSAMSLHTLYRWRLILFHSNKMRGHSTVPLWSAPTKDHKKKRIELKQH